MSEDNIRETKYYDIKLPDITKSKLQLTNLNADTMKQHSITAEKCNQKIEQSQKKIVKPSSLSVSEDKGILKIDKNLKACSKVIKSAPNEIVNQSKSTIIESPRIVFSEITPNTGISNFSNDYNNINNSNINNNKNNINTISNNINKNNNINDNGKQKIVNPSVIKNFIKKNEQTLKILKEKENTKWNFLNKHEFYPKIFRFFSQKLIKSPKIPSIKTNNASYAQQPPQPQQLQYYFNQKQQNTIKYNSISSPSIMGGIFQRLFKTPPKYSYNVYQPTVAKDNNRALGLEKSYVKYPYMPMQHFDEHLAYKQRVQVIRGSLLPSVGVFALKSAVAASMVYATSELGVWGASTKSKELWNRLVNSYNSKLFRLQPQPPVTVFDLYDGAKIHYNEFVKSTMRGAQYIAAITIKSVNYVMNM